MIKVCGKLVNKYVEKTKGGKEFDVFQVLVGGSRAVVVNIKDFQRKSNGFKVGSDVEIPVYQKAWESKGRVGIDNYLLGES